MMFYPYRRYTYNSRLSEDTIRKRLAAIVRSDHVLRSLDYPTEIDINDYTGQVWDEGFELERVIDKRNSFLPIINGKLTKDALGTRVELSMRLSMPTLIFDGLFICMVAFFLSELLPADHIPLLVKLVPCGMLLALYLMNTIPFLLEANIAKKDLSRIFECEPTQLNR
jgi:hypothetical protein